MNAASGVVTFSTDTLQVSSVSKSGSVAGLWVEDPTFSNTLGTVQFEGVVLNPGFTGSAGKFITINFVVKSAGVAKIDFSSGSILANDGAGTDIYTGARGVQLNISSKDQTKASVPENTTQPVVDTSGVAVITSSTHPDQDKWYSNNDVRVSWTLPSQSTGVMTAFDQQALTVPTQDAGLISEKQYTHVADGIWYVHVRFKNGQTYGKTAHFRLKIDTKPPTPFTITLPHGDTSDDPRPALQFNAIDALSGIAHYNIKIGDKDFTYIDPKLVKSEPYVLPPQNPGTYQVTVEAVDGAGNRVVSTKEVRVSSIEVPHITYYSEEITTGDSILVNGTSIALGTVVVTLRNSSGKTFTKSTPVDAQGDFRVTLADSIDPGLYTLTAYSVDTRQAKSIETEPVKVLVNHKPLFVIGSLVVTYVGLAVFGLCVLILLVFGMWYAWHRFLLFKKKLKQQIDDADETIHKAFELLSADIEAEVQSLERVRRKRDLTADEERIIKKFKKNFSDAETVLTKKVKNIEKELGK